MKIQFLFCLFLLAGCAKKQMMDYRPDKGVNIEEAHKTLIESILTKNNCKRPSFVIVSDQILGLGKGKQVGSDILADTTKPFKGQRIVFNDLQKFQFYTRGKNYNVELISMDDELVRTFSFKTEEDATFFIDALWKCKFAAKDVVPTVELQPSDIQQQ